MGPEAFREKKSVFFLLNLAQFTPSIFLEDSTYEDLLIDDF